MGSGTLGECSESGNKGSGTVGVCSETGELNILKLWVSVLRLGNGF